MTWERDYLWVLIRLLPGGTVSSQPPAPRAAATVLDSFAAKPRLVSGVTLFCPHSSDGLAGSPQTREKMKISQERGMAS